MLLDLFEFFHSLKIELAQLNCDCLNGQAVRKLAEDIFFKRTNIHCEFTRGWFYLFLSRHSEHIGKVKYYSVDEERGRISLEKVNEYIKTVMQILPKIKDLRLFISMDECHFGKRTNFKKRSSCVYSKKCCVPPVWKGLTDAYHESWVCSRYIY